LDRYAYVGNNPVNYVDPSGHWQEGVCRGGSDYRCKIQTAKIYQSWIENILASAVKIGIAVSVDPQEYCVPRYGAQDSDEDNPCKVGTFRGSSGIGTVVGNMSTIVTAYHVLEHALLYGTPKYLIVTNANGESVTMPWYSVHPERIGNSDQLILHLGDPLPKGFVKPASANRNYFPSPGDVIEIVYQDEQGHLQVMFSAIWAIPINGGTYGALYYVALNADATLNAGDSGGGVFYNGQFIGLTSAVYIWMWEDVVNVQPYE
jgi:hypothetical protein